MSLHARDVLPHGEWHGALLGGHAPPVGLHLWLRMPGHQPKRMQGMNPCKTDKDGNEWKKKTVQGLDYY